MKRRPMHGVLVISIDVAGDSVALGASNRLAITPDTTTTLEVTKWLLRLLDQYRLPATWFLAGPGTSVLRSHVVAADIRQEVGLLVVDGGPQSRARVEFARNLQRRLLAARAAGIDISSVATQASRRIDHLDLLIKHGIRAVRPGARGLAHSAVERCGWAAVSTLRFGISSLPPTWRAVDAPRWQRWIKAWEARRQIVAAARRRQYCHLTLDIHTLANAGAREVLRQTLRVASRLVHSSGMRAETVSSVAASLVARPSAPCAQSILRAA